MKKHIEIVLLLIFVFVSSNIWAATRNYEPQTPQIQLQSILEETIIQSAFPNLNVGNLGKIDICNSGILSDCKVSSPFGWRKHPIRRAGHYHSGVDMTAKTGTPIFLPFSGVVKSASWSRGYGKLVVVEHGYGWVTKYAHLSEMDVKPGDKLSAGKVIGSVGSTGVSTGAHLHFEIEYMGKNLDPQKYFAILQNTDTPTLFFAMK